MRNLRSRDVACATFLVIVSLSALGRAQDESPRIAEARRHFQQGEQYAQSRDWALARTEFQRAFDLMEGHPNRPFLYYNLAICSEELGLNADAVRFYDSFLTEAAADAPFRPDAERRVRELRTRMALQQRAAGGWSPSPVGLIIGGAGIASMIVAAITGSLALAGNSDIAAMCASDGLCPPALEARAYEVQTLAITTDLLLFGGLAITATGAILTFVLGGSPSPTQTAGVACGQTGCGVYAAGVF